MTSRTLGYAGDRMTNMRPDGLDRMTNVRISRIIAAPLRPVRALASGQLTFDLDVRVRKAPSRKAREKDYPAGPYPWTLEQAQSCVTAHARWGDLHYALRTCWMDERPACWPPSDVLPAEVAVMYLLSEFARIHVARKEKA
jgi:hypothetical protein